MQESFLDPILFNIYVSDMPSVVNSSILQLTDYAKMFRVISHLMSLPTSNKI